jgi:hypothetical protein
LAVEALDNPARHRYEATVDGKPVGFAAYRVRPSNATETTWTSFLSRDGRCLACEEDLPGTEVASGSIPTFTSTHYRGRVARRGLGATATVPCGSLPGRVRAIDGHGKPAAWAKASG